MRAELEREDGTVETANALLDAKFVLNQLSRTEAGAMIEAMSFEVSPELKIELDQLR